MKTFKSISDVARVRNHPAYQTVSRLVARYLLTQPDYNADNDGYVVLMEREDVDRELVGLQLSYRLDEVPFEGVKRIDSYFLASYVPNNQFVLSFLIPDEPWIDGALRRHLESHLDL